MHHPIREMESAYVSNLIMLVISMLLTTVRGLAMAWEQWGSFVGQQRVAPA